jgi:hypothetical protein
MKMSVRTSFSSRRPPASAFTRGRGFTRKRGKNRVHAGVDPRPRGRGTDAGPRGPVTARTRVDTRRAATGPRGCGKASARARGRANARPWGGAKFLGFPL